MPIKITFGSRNFRPPKNPVIALGVFDGVHRGHRNIFQKALRRAKEIGGTAVVYTFDPHPVKILAPDACPPMITTLAQRIELIAGQGIRHIVVEKFTKTFSHQTPEKFFLATIVKRLEARELFVGYNFTFGVHRSGNIDHLKSFGRKTGIRVNVVEPYLRGETLVSSTQVRQVLARGNLPKAEELLARPYFMEGRVVHGHGRGKKLGIHTANLEPDNDLILPTGVYITVTWVSGKKCRSVTNIGANPTFGPAPVTIESHLLGFSRSLLGRTVRIEFFEKIREEIAFSSPSALADQIRKDIRRATEFFAKRE